MNDRLFISYRRSADSWAVSHLLQRLQGEFGRDQVFFDTDSMQSGELWRERIRSGLHDASAVVVVFGSTWYGQGEDGSRRIDQPDDPVRWELTQAHAHGKPIVPVVIDQSAVPTARDLPEDLRFLADLHFRRLNPTDSVDRQVNRLIGDIRLAIHGLRPWMRIALHSLWMGALACALAGGLQLLGLTAPFTDAFASTARGLRAAQRAPAPDELALVEIDDNEFRELFGGRLPLDPTVMAIALDAMTRQSTIAGRCGPESPVGINLDLSPGEANANNGGALALLDALGRLSDCRPLVLACPQSIERRAASANDWDWRRRLVERKTGYGVVFASTLIDPAVLRHSAGRRELGVMVGDLAARRAPSDDPTGLVAMGRECACPGDAPALKRCDTDHSATAAAQAWDRRAMVVPFGLAAAPRYSLADALAGGQQALSHSVVLIGGSFGTQGRYPVSGLAEAAQRGVTGTTVHGFLANSALHHTPARWPLWAATLTACAAAAATCLAVTLCWWRASRLPHRFSLRAAWYTLALVVAAGLPVVALASAVAWPSWAWLAGHVALACLVATARSAVAGTELLVHGGVGWKSPRGLWRAVSSEADRASAVMRLVVFCAEALLILSFLVGALSVNPWYT